MQAMEERLYQFASNNINAQKQLAQNQPYRRNQQPLAAPTKEEFIQYFTARRQWAMELAANALIKTAAPLVAIVFFEYQQGWGNALTSLIKWGLAGAVGIEIGALIAFGVMTPEGVAWHSQNMVETGNRLSQAANRNQRQSVHSPL